MKLRNIRSLGSAVTIALLLFSPAAFAEGGEGGQGQQPGDQQPAPAPTPAPDGSAPSSGPTVSLGTTASKDTPKEDEKKEEKKEENTLFWRGTTFYGQTSMSTTTFAPAQQQTQAATVESWFLFQPQITFGKKPSKTEFTPSFQVRGRFTMAIEWTDTAATSTTTKNEPVFGDSILYGYYTGIPEIPKVGIRTKVGIALGLPTSKTSIMRTMILSPGVTAAFSKSFEKIGGNEDLSANLGVSATLSKPIYAYTTGGWNNPTGNAGYGRSCYGATEGCVNQVSATANVEWSLPFLFSASFSWKKLDLSSFFFFTNAWAYTFTKAPETHIDNPTNFRQSTYFNLAADYNITKWIAAEVGYYMQRNLIDGNGKIGNPFFDTMQDMRVYLAANLTLDELYLSLAGGSKKTEAKHELQPASQNIAAVH